MYPQTMYLSSNGNYLMNILGENILEKRTSNGSVYYRLIILETEAFERVCKEVTTIKVCSVWNNENECLKWIHVDVCTKCELVSTGFSNIS